MKGQFSTILYSYQNHHPKLKIILEIPLLFKDSDVEVNQNES